MTIPLFYYHASIYPLKRVSHQAICTSKLENLNLLSLRAVWLYLALLCLPCLAQEQPAPQAEQLLQQALLLGNLQYQITPASTTAEQLVRDPAQFHSFRPLSGRQATLRLNEQQVLWLLIKVSNPYPESWQAMLYYPFLPADRISFYQLQPEIPSVKLLGKSGSLLPYSERALPLRGYSQPIQFKANEQHSYLLQIQDAALLGTQVKLGTLPILMAEEQQQLVGEALLTGALLLLVIFTLAIARAHRNPAYISLALFYLCFALVLSVLNGLGFSLLWPTYPELNPVLLYISVGLCLLALTHYCRLTLLRQSGSWARLLNALATASALLLLFSPLYADGELKLKLLFSCVSLTLSLCIIQALLVSLTTNLAGAPRYALLSTLATLCLLLVQARHLAGFADWLNPGLLLLVAITALALPQPRPN
ncbi:response regulator receiver domain protein (CheY-) [Alishewanella agri BL06]|uniref:Response regulator receiver domain protein (CheY-) n=1 Tax=Alishewanella agri BL06 TaxID=1195246 RepID=I9P227_9ALTE|nr:7TM diverse intracellular signaling domain-containing protein [Alishewanella agri]EIW88992.1 response regulator receiver domain protein (CheY-) [Alishewanella agri BL06]